MVVYVTLTVPNVILTESFLSFLGLGVQEPDVELGRADQRGRAATMEIAPWALHRPRRRSWRSRCSALNFIGDGLRDAFDPKDR